MTWQIPRGWCGRQTKFNMDGVNGKWNGWEVAFRQMFLFHELGGKRQIWVFKVKWFAQLLNWHLSKSPKTPKPLQSTQYTLPGVIFSLSLSSHYWKWEHFLIELVAKLEQKSIKTHPSFIFSSKLLPNTKYPVMLRDTGLCFEPPAVSICVIVPEGGWHQCHSFHAAHHPLWADLARCILPFQSLEGHRKRQKETLFMTGRGGVIGHRAHTLSSPHPPPVDWQGARVKGWSFCRSY